MTIGVIYISDQTGRAIRWALGDGEQLNEAGRVDSLNDIPDQVLNADTLFAVLPGSVAATRRILLPVKGEKALKEAASIAFEDVLSQPVDKFHFAFGPVRADNARLVSAVPVQWLDEQIDNLLTFGIDPDVITLDHLAVWADGYDTVVLRDEDYVAARLPKGALSGQADFTLNLIEKMDTGDRFLPVVVGDSDDENDNTLFLEDDRAFGAFMLTGLADQRAPSFRRGAFAKRRDWGAMAKPWKTAGALMAACLGIWFVNLGADGFRHQRAADNIYTESLSQFSSAFPNVVVRDLQRQAAQRAGRSSGESEFLYLSVELTSAIEKAVAVQLSSITYTEENQLIAELRFPDAASLEQIKSFLDEKGISTREGGNLRREDNGDYSGRLFLGDGV